MTAADRRMILGYRGHIIQPYNFGGTYTYNGWKQSKITFCCDAPQRELKGGLK